LPLILSIVSRQQKSVLDLGVYDRPTYKHFNLEKLTSMPLVPPTARKTHCHMHKCILFKVINKIQEKQKSVV